MSEFKVGDEITAKFKNFLDQELVVTGHIREIRSGVLCCNDNETGRSFAVNIDEVIAHHIDPKQIEDKAKTKQRMFEMDKCREEFLKQHNPKLLKIVKFDESKNGFVLHDHLDLTDINLSALAEINYGWTLWQHLQAKVEELQKRVDLALLGVSGVMRWVEEDAIDDPDFIKGGVLSALRRLEHALKGEAND